MPRKPKFVRTPSPVTFTLAFPEAIVNVPGTVHCVCDKPEMLQLTGVSSPPTRSVQV
jgi:hypothetical protein